MNQLTLSTTRPSTTFTRPTEQALALEELAVSKSMAVKFRGTTPWSHAPPTVEGERRAIREQPTRCSAFVIYRQSEYAIRMTITEMREPTFLVLAALADGRKHGYALIAEAAELSDGRVQLKVGTLYAALDRLGEQGLVEGAGDEVVAGRLRRYYKLTDVGALRLEEEAARLAANAASARAKLRSRTAAKVATA